MKIMIPASGGLDSTTLLWETLSRGTDDVVAVHYREDYAPEFLANDFAHRSRTAFDAVAEWLSDNLRPFETRSGPVRRADSRGIPFDPDQLTPIREGFLVQARRYWHRCRYATHGYYAHQVRADEIHLALTTWNRRRGASWLNTERVDIADYSDAALREPWLARSQNGVFSGRSRLGNLRALPAELHALTICCNRLSDAACGTCGPCTAKRFYDAICADLDADGLAQVEARIEERAQFGPHSHRADPTQYRHDILNDTLQDLDEWRIWRNRTPHAHT